MNKFCYHFSQICSNFELLSSLEQQDTVGAVGNLQHSVANFMRCLKISAIKEFLNWLRFH